MSVRTVQRVVRTIANRASISRRVSPHVLRHTFSVTAVQKGISLPALQRLLGHDHLATTEIYLNLSPEQSMLPLRILTSHWRVSQMPVPGQRHKSGLPTRQLGTPNTVAGELAAAFSGKPVYLPLDQNTHNLEQVVIGKITVFNTYGAECRREQIPDVHRLWLMPAFVLITASAPVRPSAFARKRKRSAMAPISSISCAVSYHFKAFGPVAAS